MNVEQAPPIVREEAQAQRMGSGRLVPKDPLSKGFSFGSEGTQYQILTVLGEGAFSRVYKCQVAETSSDQQQLGDVFAVKVVDFRRLQMHHDFEKLQENLRREVEILRTLRHERIVNLHHFFATEDHWYLVMELVCHGELLHSIRPLVGMPDLEAKYVFQQLVEGIGYINSKGIVHRDLKPENILIVRIRNVIDERAGGVPCKLYDIKIADFGLSKVREADYSAQSRVGTPVYAAPEIFKGKYNEQVDAFSLGAILYVMLCGQYPFDGRSIPRQMLVGVVSEVRASCGAKGVSYIELRRAGGSVRVHGQAGETQLGPWNLSPSEHIIAVLQAGKSGPEALGSSFAMLTSSARLFELDGPEGTDYIRATAPAKAQVIGLELEDGELQALKSSGAKATGPGAVAAIAGRVGSQVDCIELRLRDGTTTKHGGNGGTPIGPFPLDEDELLLAVVQEKSGKFLGYAWYFVTSKGRVIEVRGSGARPLNSVAVPVGQQIDDLHFGADGRLDGSVERDPIRCANFRMDTTRWETLSSDVKQVVYGLLNAEPSSRLTLEACMHMPWLLDSRLPNQGEEFASFIHRGSQRSFIEQARHDAQEVSDPEAIFDPTSRSEGSTSTLTGSPTGQCSGELLPHEIPEEPVPAAGGDLAEAPGRQLAEAPGRERASSKVTRGSSKEPRESRENQVFGAIAQIRGRLGSAVDRVELQLWTGQSLCYGGHGGGPVGPWKLKHDEYLTAVEQEFRSSDFGYLGNELAFFTSRGRVITFTGSFAPKVHRFAAARGTEITKLCFNGSALCGIETAPCEGRIAQVSCRLADCIDQVQLAFRDGTVISYGGAGGEQRPPFTLHAGEYIVAVSQEHADEYLGNAFAFFMSSGDVVQFDGRRARRRQRHAAPQHQQIWGLRFEGSRLAKVIVRAHARGRGTEEEAEPSK